MRDEQQNILRLLLTGLACGDSLGSSSEFVPQSKIPALYKKLKGDGWPFKQVGGGPFGWKPGAPTDDSDQAMCLARSFLELAKFDPEDVGKRFVAWMDSGPADIGGTTSRSLTRLRNKPKIWHESGLFEYVFNSDQAANGSLMRNGVLPALMIGEDLDALFRATVQHSIITHYHPLAVLCCAAHSWIIADELGGWEQGPAYDSKWLDSFYEDWTNYVAGEDDPYVGAWLDNVRETMQAAGETLTEADWDPKSFNPFEVDFTGQDGYCLLTLQIAVWALLWSKSNDEFDVPHGFPAEVFARRGPWTLAWTAMIGHDADTYGAVAGPLIAVAHGSLPAELVEGLKAVAEFDSIVAAMVSAIVAKDRSKMYWADKENIILDSGRKAQIAKGVIGLDMDGSVLHTGGEPMVARSHLSGASTELTVAEKLDVARYQLRSWQNFVANLEKAASQQPSGSQSEQNQSLFAPLTSDAKQAAIDKGKKFFGSTKGKKIDVG